MKALCVFACSIALAVPLAAEESPGTPELPKHYLVELDCDPENRGTVETMMRTALALREDRSVVTLFIDLEAVSLAKPTGDKAPELNRETERLFAKLRAAGIEVWVCPHCAGLKELSAKSLRDGLRFTTKEELEAARDRADKVFQCRPAKPKESSEEQGTYNSRVT